MKVIQKARQMAKRTRAAVACARCKSGKLRCSDFRPCKQCTKVRSSCSTITQAQSAGSETMISARQITQSQDSNMSSMYFGRDHRAGTTSDESCRLEMQSVVLHQGQQTYSPDQTAAYPSNHPIETPRALAFEGMYDYSYQPLNFIPRHEHGTQMGFVQTPPLLVQHSSTMLPALLPHAVAALLRGLTQPVQHSPPPPNALNILLAMACAVPQQAQAHYRL